MGEKKQKEKAVAQWKKIVVLGACVLFAVLMIVSGMGSGWISAFNVVKPGDTVIVDFTFYDAGGNPIITTNMDVYKTAATEGKSLLIAKPISLTSNQSLIPSLYPVQVYTTNAGWAGPKFALLRPEFEAVSSGIVGLKANEQKRITIPSSASMTQLWSSEQLKRNGVNMTDINIGDVLTMAVSDNPEEMATNLSAQTYMRVGEVSTKSHQGVVVDFGYPAADVRVVSINAKN